MITFNENFEIVRYPAGEFRVTGRVDKGSLYRARVQDCIPEDLIILNIWADAVHRQRGRTEVFIPYFPGAREDRGAPLGAKVYADLVNLGKHEQVTIVDPHSDVAPALINNCKVVTLGDLIPLWSSVFSEFRGVIAPDGGGTRRAFEVAQVLGVPLYQGGKHRDPATGKLSGFWCDSLPDENLLIVDDICDGGGTFMGLADVCDTDKLSLWVTHGIFTGDNLLLAERFNLILTTDSFTTATPPGTVRLPLEKVLETR